MYYPDHGDSEALKPFLEDWQSILMHHGTMALHQGLMYWSLLGRQIPIFKSD